MRLTDYEVKTIKDIFKKADENCDIYLFGSRTDDLKKGGDIDLIVFSQKLVQSDARQVCYEICEKIGEQKIDLLIEKDMSKPFTRIVMEDSIRL